MSSKKVTTTYDDPGRPYGNRGSGTRETVEVDDKGSKTVTTTVVERVYNKHGMLDVNHVSKSVEVRDKK